MTTSRPVRRTAPHAAPAVARMTSPGEVAALVSTLCGFVPQESLVLVSLRGPRRRIGLTVRSDLPLPDGEPSLADELVARIAADGATAVLAVVLTERGDPSDGEVGRGLAEAVRRACERRRLVLSECLLVRRGRWTSYLCEAPSCCPPGGTPLPGLSTPALQLVAAEAALQGRAVLASRDDLVRSVAVRHDVDAARRDEELGQSAAWWVAQKAAKSEEVVRQRALVTARELLDHPAIRVSGSEAVALAVALADVVVRDEVAAGALKRRDDLLAVLLQVAPQVVGVYAAPVCSVLAWAAYSGGDGGLANVALDRALAADPDYGLARLLERCVAGQVPPEEVRDVLRGTERVLALSRGSGSGRA